MLSLIVAGNNLNIFIEEGNTNIMGKIRSLFICIILALGFVSCSSNESFYVTSQNESQNYYKYESINEPLQKEKGELKKITSPLMNDETYSFCDFIWLNDREVLILQRNQTNELLYRLIAYNVIDSSERLFFSWGSKQFSNSEIFLSENQIKVYSDYRLYELDMSGVVLRETEYKVTYRQLSIDGDYAERSSSGGTYIINAFTDSWRKIFDNTDKVYYHPISFGWSSDGQYLALTKEEWKTIENPDTKSDSFFMITGVVIVDKEGNPVLMIPFEGDGYMEWLYDSHEIALLRHPDTVTPLDSLMIVDTRSGEQVGSYDFTNRETVLFNIGKQDCVMLIDAITYDEIGAPSECDTYIYNYQESEKEFFCKLNEYPGRILFSPDGQRAVLMIGFEHDIYLYNFS